MLEGFTGEIEIIKTLLNRIKKVNNKMVKLLISTAVRILIGWLLIDRVSAWLNLRGIIATIIKVIGVLIIISALLAWV